jgi:hypothetical protein
LAMFRWFDCGKPAWHRMELLMLRLCDFRRGVFRAVLLVSPNNCVGLWGFP